jgi:hypothetical protein
LTIGYSHPPLNKPHAIANWVANHSKSIDDDHEIIIVDPGKIFFLQFSNFHSQKHEIRLFIFKKIEIWIVNKVI